MGRGRDKRKKNKKRAEKRRKSGRKGEIEACKQEDEECLTTQRS